MNQKLGVILTYIFLIGVGLFNLSAGISYLKKRNRSSPIGILRIVVGAALLIVAILLYRQLRPGLAE